MDRIGRIAVSAILAMTILLFGAGVNVAHCAHSDVAKVLTADDGCCDENDCDRPSGCMVIEHFQLSPTPVTQRTVYDFHITQAGTTVFGGIPAQWFRPATAMTARAYTRHVPLPPRAYLSLIRILQI